MKPTFRKKGTANHAGTGYPETAPGNPDRPGKGYPEDESGEAEEPYDTCQLQEI